jgi:quinol monooxygenase YgiN
MVATLKLKEGAEAAALRAIEEVARPTRAEPGCLQYTFAQASGEPTTLVVVERWRDRRAKEEHLETPHLATFRKAFSGLLAGTPIVAEYREV